MEQTSLLRMKLFSIKLNEILNNESDDEDDGWVVLPPRKRGIPASPLWGKGVLSMMKLHF